MASTTPSAATSTCSGSRTATPRSSAASASFATTRAATVDRVRATRDSIAAKKAELERTRQELEAREAQLDRARGRSKQALTRIDGHVDHLEGDVSDIQKKIQEQLAAASGVSTLPAGPIQGGSAGFIWPVNGPIVSGFGMRWGTLHEGIDIAVPAGTPIRAAKDGTIAFAADRGRERRLRQLHLHRPRRRALHLLRPPVELRDHLRARSSRAT